ncbi:MAG: TonB-dependent receptor [Bacteroidales bacterium]
MKKSINIILLILLPVFVFGQSNVTIKKDVKDTTGVNDLNQIVVSATKTKRPIFDIPVRIKAIPSYVFQAMSLTNPEDPIQNVSGANVSRNHGIFDKHAYVILRGMGGGAQARTQILIDGIPINKASTGGVNFNMINMENIKTIEIVKGPNSNLFGGNAMGGSVNFITKTPKEKLDVKVSLDYGSYNSIILKEDANKRFGDWFFDINANYSHSDGYYQEEHKDNEEVTSLYMHEGGIGGSIGRYIGGNQKILVDYHYYDGLRSEGERTKDASNAWVNAENRYKTHSARLNYIGSAGKSHWDLSAFLNYESMNEVKFKSSDIYDVRALRRDWGAWISYNYNFSANNTLSAGLEYKGGSVIGKDIYRTSTDLVKNEGSQDLFAVNLQDEIKFLDERLIILPSVRIDIAHIGEGEFSVYNATSTTSIFQQFTGKINKADWTAFSPKLALEYEFNNNARLYTSFSRGFRPGALEDMCRTGWTQGGITIANPDLKPEYVNNYEIGGDFSFFNMNDFSMLTISPSLYYAYGTDFIYKVNTGEKVQVGRKYKPLLKQSNIGGVEMYGAELDINYQLTRNLNLFSNFTYSNSEIKKFDINPDFGDTDLTGKVLSYSPKLMYNLGLNWNYNSTNLYLNYRFKTKQYMTSDNLEDGPNKYGEYEINTIPSMGVCDAKIQHTFKENYILSIGVNNIFDRTYITASGYESIGAFAFLRIAYKF